MTEKHCVITGVGGFVGRALAQRLVRSGMRVSGIARRPIPDIERIGVRVSALDLARGQSAADALKPVFEGADVVFHVAAKVDMWGAYDDFFNVNVLGTRAVLSACQAAGVPHLVYTSSPSVVADGGNLAGVDETAPYPARYMAHYPATKAMAEREVLQCGRNGMLRTVALRPHLIFGPGDSHLVPTILERARAGRLVQVGKGDNKSDFTFIDDCVEAHVCAWQALARGGVSGKAYFISQGDAVPLWGWINDVLRYHNMPPVSRTISKRLALMLATCFEMGSRVLPGNKPLFTKFLVSQMSTDHYFNIAAARTELGYSPSCTVSQALERSFGSRPYAPGEGQSAANSSGTAFGARQV